VLLTDPSLTSPTTPMIGKYGLSAIIETEIDEANGSRPEK
jgi:hypothetical protein